LTDVFVARVQITLGGIIDTIVVKEWLQEWTERIDALDLTVASLLSKQCSCKGQLPEKEEDEEEAKRLC
jgi:hypothetical protein